VEITQQNQQLPNTETGISSRKTVQDAGERTEPNRTTALEISLKTSKDDLLAENQAKKKITRQGKKNEGQRA
jgi:hypothetical protein